MAPNLFVVAKKIFQPHTWFQSRSPVPLSKTERWSEPIPGLYKHVPIAGWYLIALEEGDPHRPRFRNLHQYRKVDYCRVLRRWMFHEDVEARSRDGFILNKRSQKEPLKFFCLDDEIMWVQCFDVDGRYLEGPYDRYEFDEERQRFRPMKKADRPIMLGRTSSGYADSGVGSVEGSRSQSKSGGSDAKSRTASLIVDGRPAASRRSTGARPDSPFSITAASAEREKRAKSVV